MRDGHVRGIRSAPDLYVVVERSVFDSDAAWLRALEALGSLTIPGLALQVRAKDETPERARQLAIAAREVTEGVTIPVLLNGSTEQALELGFGGVHWPEALIPARETEAGLLRGASVHSPAAAKRAEDAGAHFVVAGTVFDAGSKEAPGAGLAHLKEIASATSLPVLAIGGVTAERVASCVDVGAAGIAVVSAVLRAHDMAAAVRGLREALDEALVAGRARR